MRKVLLLSSGHSFFKGALWGNYDFELPINVAYVAAFLKSKGYQVDVVDFQVIKDPLMRLDGLNYDNYFIIGINSDLGSTGEAYKIASLIKKRFPAKLIFSFGVYTILKEIILQECRDIDYVIYGEEEHTIYELTDSVFQRKDAANIKGLIFRKGLGISVNPPREYEYNLDKFPFPDRDKFDLTKYFPSPGKYFVLPQFSVLSSRGCNRQCFFCSNLRGKGIRYRSAENVVAEIEELQTKYGAREINFIDDAFTADREWVLEFVKLLTNRNKRIYLRICSRIDTVDEEILSKLKEVGLYSIGYGIESGVNEILKFNKKGITVSQIKDVVNITKKIGLEVRGFFMLNMPGDTTKTTEKTVKFIKELNLDLVNVQITYPWPGTEMRDFIKENYKIDESLWNNWGCCDGDDILFIQADLTPDYIVDTYHRIIREHYLNPRFIIRWIKRIHTLQDLKYSFLQLASLLKRAVSESLNKV